MGLGTRKRLLKTSPQEPAPIPGFKAHCTGTELVISFAMPQENLLIIGTSERNANLYYATHFVAPDPFVFFRIKGKKILLLSDLEIDRARKEARADRIFSSSLLAKKFREKTGRAPFLTDLVLLVLKEYRVRSVSVPADFPFGYALTLKRAGIRLSCKHGMFFPERLIKTPAEIAAIRETLRATEKAAAAAILLIRRSVIRKERLFHAGQPLTSESVRKLVHTVLSEHGCTGEHTIVSCGHHSINPHDQGSGPLFAHKPVLFDIFPRNDKTLYYADFSRTIVKGKASARLKNMYAAVKEGQSIAIQMIRPGIAARTIHEAVQKRFEELGFKTGLVNGRRQGFFHSTGHGLGLEIHEPPRLGPGTDILKTGQVITVEPGLYYQGTGGVRLEDVVLVTKNGCRNLTQFPKILEV